MASEGLSASASSSTEAVAGAEKNDSDELFNDFYTEVRILSILPLGYRVNNVLYCHMKSRYVFLNCQPVLCSELCTHSVLHLGWWVADSQICNTNCPKKADALMLSKIYVRR